MARTNKVKEEEKTPIVKEVKEEVKAPKEYKIIAPNKQYTGVAATVEFIDGVGYTKNEAIKRYFEAKGFEIV